MRPIVVLSRLPAPILLASAMLCAPGLARAQDMLALMRAGQWSAADAAASRYADPVARKLVAFERLIEPGGGSAAEIAAFMADSPDWPLQGVLARRRDEALAIEPDDGEARSLCPSATAPAALLRCGDAFAQAGESAEATAFRRRAWIAGLSDPATEARFLQRFGGELSGSDEWRRFTHLLGQPAAARRQEARLDPPHRLAAEALAAMRRGDAKAQAALERVPAALRDDPALVLEQARWLRQADRADDELALFRAEGADATRAADADQLTALWGERQKLARVLLMTGDNQGAAFLVAHPGRLGPEDQADAEFLAGWIALRKLNDPRSAEAHFRALAALSAAAITQGRAHYWLARALAATGAAEAAKAEYAEGAKWLTTYYGQLADMALGDSPRRLSRKLAALRDPRWQPEDALTFAGHELARAAAILASWGDGDGTRLFLSRLEDLVPASADRAMAARLAAGLGMLPQSVAIARRAGAVGVMLPETGWPAPYQPPAAAGVEPSLALAIARQESNFNPYAVSSAGARGLMQLMPATAQFVARQAGLQVSPAALTGDANTNMLLGGTYLANLVDHYGGSIPLAVAAYNAGPSHVAQWLAANADPRVTGSVDMIDWIEMIPFNETRNYVQRVVENLMIYRARADSALPDPVLPIESQAALVPSNG